MSERDENTPPDVIRDAPRDLPAVSDRGIDLWQIRRLLALTPAQRLRVGVGSANNVMKLRSRRRRK